MGKESTILRVEVKTTNVLRSEWQLSSFIFERAVSSMLSLPCTSSIIAACRSNLDKLLNL